MLAEHHVSPGSPGCNRALVALFASPPLVLLPLALQAGAASHKANGKVSANPAHRGSALRKLGLALLLTGLTCLALFGLAHLFPALSL